MEAINLILFGFIVYTALIVVPSIWEELNVIGVTDGIYNDTVAVTKANPEIYNEEFITALQNALIKVIESDEGKAIFEVLKYIGVAYNEIGYNQPKSLPYPSENPFA